MKRRVVPGEAIADLRIRLDQLNSRNHERVELIQGVADTYGVSIATVYRELNEKMGPKRTRRSDHGHSRKLEASEIHRYCEVIAALKSIRNKRGRHMATSFAIHLIETCGIDTPQGRVKAPPGLLNKSLVNRHLQQLGLQFEDLLLEPPVVRFQAEESNACWQFDISRSDLKDLPEHPSWIDCSRGRPKLMLFSVTDDRSGVCYQDYFIVYGEEIEAVLRFLYRAMAPKADFPFQGIPEMIYCDNGPFRKSAIFNRVMECLDIEFKSHMPAGSDGRRTTSRSKGKVERPFRTIKETHEVLYHKHKPTNEDEANQWLHHHLYSYYNTRKHRSEKHTRIDDWQTHLPLAGFRQMCSWEKYSSFAREPVDRTVSSESKVSLDGVDYEVSAELMGLEVTVLLGVLDNQIFVQHKDVRYGPYQPAGGPIPLHTYRKHGKTKREKQADRIEDLAKQISIPRSAMTGIEDDIPPALVAQELARSVPFPEEPESLDFASASEARLAIRHYLGIPIANLTDESRSFVSTLVLSTLNKQDVLSKVKSHFSKSQKKADKHAKP